MSLEINQETQNQEVENQSQSQEQEIPKSEILDEEEVNELLSGEENKETSENEEKLPSDQSEDDELLAGKYKTAEELEKAYKELEKKLGEKPKEEPKEESEDEEGSKKIEPIPDEVFQTYAERYRVNQGKLSEEDYKELAEQGYDADFVDTYIAGVIAKNKAKGEAILSELGTNMDEYQQAVEWAKTNWTAEQQKEYNDALASTTEKGSKFIVKGLIDEYMKNKGNTNQPIHSNTGLRQASTGGYSTKSDYLKDAQDPRYDKDPAYRAKVEAKVAQTDMSKWYN